MSLRRLGPRAMLGVAAPSGTGKTTLLEGLIPALCAAGWRVAVLKHHHHGPLTLDVPGKDSWRLRQAGAWRVTLASDVQWGTFCDAIGTADPRQVAHDQLQGADLVLVEGARSAGLPSLLLHRREVSVDPLWQPPAQVCAIVTNDPALLRQPPALASVGVPYLPLDAPEQVAAWIAARWLRDALPSPLLTVVWLRGPEIAARAGEEVLRGLASALSARPMVGGQAGGLWEALVAATTPEVLVLWGAPERWLSPSSLQRLRRAAPEGCDAIAWEGGLWCGPRCLGAMHAARLDGGDWATRVWVHTLGAREVASLS